MKTHLPHGLRAALMAALASVSLTSYAAAAGLEGWTDAPSTATKETINITGDYTYNPTGKKAPLNLTFQPGTAFNRETASYLYVTRSAYTGDIYATATNSPFGYSTATKSYFFVGLGGQVDLNGNMYIRSTGNTSYSGIGTMIAVDYGSTVTKNVYLGLADQNTHSGGVYLAKSSKVQGTSKMEIASGTFNGTVAVGLSNTSGYSTNLVGGTELRISGGLFKNNVVAGSHSSQSSTIGGIGTNLVIKGGEFTSSSSIVAGSSGAGTSTISGGTHTTITGGTFNGDVIAGSSGTGTSTITDGTNMLINGGTFNGDVIAGSSGTGTSTITDGTHLVINGGTFNGDIYGASKDAGRNCNTIEGGVNITINGGTFKGGKYGQYILGCGNDGNEIVHGGININISGNTSFQDSVGTYIYAQGKGCDNAAGEINITISGDGVKFNENASVAISAWNDKGTSSSCSGATITLADLTNASDFAKDTKNEVGFYIRGLGRASTLELSNVNADFKKEIGDFNNVVVKNGSHVTLDTDETQMLQWGNKTLGRATTVTVENGSTLTSEGISVSGRDEKGATITKGSTATLATATKIQDAKVELAGTASINTQLENVDLVNTKAATTMTVNNISGTQNTATVSSKATVNLMNIGEGKDGILKELNISGEGKLGVYINGTAAAGEKDANVGNLTLAEGGKITIGTGGGTLEANLTTESGSTLDFSAGVALTMGCELHVGDDTCIVLSGADYDSLLSGGTVTLFTGVDNVINAEMAASDLVICKAAVNGTQLDEQVSFYTDGNKNAVLTLTANVPEPTTGTLSLLALAGLAARRRRKH